MEGQREAFLNNALNTHIPLQVFFQYLFSGFILLPVFKKCQSPHNGSRNACVTISVKLHLHWGAGGERLWRCHQKALLGTAVHSSAPHSLRGSAQRLSSARTFPAHLRDQPVPSQAKLPLTA